MKFSERQGFKPARTVFQIDSVDEPLLNCLWNVLQDYIIQPSRNGVFFLGRFFYDLWLDHYKLRIDRMPDDESDILEYAEHLIFEGQWYEIYDFMEFCLAHYPERRFIDNTTDFLSAENLRAACNRCLEREMSAWRVVDKRVTRLTSSEEIEAVEAAQALEDKFTPASIHITTAVNYFSDRKSPDYRNAIKEAISAVESMCRIITNNPKATLGDALKQIEAVGIKLHPAFKLALEKLYGYASDQGGIRHSLLEQSTTIDFEDAKYMVVSCAAFVNLLKARST
jgi:hypothetical protein